MILTDLKNIRAFVLDVDGVLTDGMVQVNEQGDQLRTFNIKDGYALQLAIKRGYPIFIITGGNSMGVQKRLTGLGIKEVHVKIANKLHKMIELADKYNLQLSELLYIGDDVPDLICMKAVGIAVCPSDAVEEIKAISHYVSAREGGKGIVRELLEKVMKLQGQWFDDEMTKSI